ncbi:MAG: fumarylacetoacetate hydrolase family protein [Nitrososphaerota archaeon]|nr:fumarylacetoacetate hydrolase family protein [Nitrososphaerota archaeon]
MKLLTYEVGGKMRAGALEGDTVREIPGFSGVDELIAKGGAGAARRMATGEEVALQDVKVRAPLRVPDKVLLAAVNYKAHGGEQKTALPTEPYFFTKFPSCIIGEGDPVVVPKVSSKVDWEAELGVVIGRKCKYASKAQALSFVAGYTVAMDVSFRDLQFPKGWPEKTNTLGQNWVKGKALDSALPLGPWIVTADEIPDPQRLDIGLKVNGVERQKANTEDMIFSVAELIAYLSDGITLHPGDLISTGTPAGVAAFTNAPYLKPGDVIETTVGRIGTLHNPVSAE